MGMEEYDAGRLQLQWLWYSIGAMMLFVVTAASLLPAPDVGVGDKLSHLVTYVLLAGWFSLLAVNHLRLAFTLLGLLAYGGLIELLQGMTGYRYPEWGDLLANGIGIVLGGLVYFTPLVGLLQKIDSLLARALRR